MTEKDAFLVDYVEGGLRVDNTDAGIVGRTVDAIRIREKWENDDYMCRGHILNGISDSLFDVYTNVESAKELWDSLESKYMTEDSSKKSLREQDRDKRKGKEVGGPSVNMIEEKVVIRRTQMLVVREKGLRTIPKTKVDAIAWWIDSGATTHVCKDRFRFKTYEPMEDGSVLYMGDDHFAPIHEKGSKGFLSSVERGRCVKEKDKRGTPAVNTRFIEATTIGKNSVVYVNEAGKATMNVIESTLNVDEFGNGNKRVNVDATYTPNVEQPHVVGDEEDAGNVSDWVKLHDVPLTAFSEDGLSAIATKLSMLLMLDSYTSNMCMNHGNIISDVLKNINNPRQAVIGIQGEFKVAWEGTNSEVVTSTHGTLSEKFGSLNTTPLAKNISNLKRKMLDGKHVLVDDDGKPINKVDSPFNADSDSEVDEDISKNLQAICDDWDIKEGLVINTTTTIITFSYDACHSQKLSSIVAMMLGDDMSTPRNYHSRSIAKPHGDDVSTLLAITIHKKYNTRLRGAHTL
nr:zinc finger, CCHC-type [Tanacetum cinerariifolium]